MEIENLFSKETIERFSRHEESFDERDTLIKTASKVLTRNVNYSCRNCYMDVLTELVYLYTHKKEIFNEKIKDKRYVFKRGLCFPVGFGSPKMIIYQNCTDELAIEFLSLHPDNVQYFDRVPDVWKDEVEDFKAKQIAGTQKLEKSEELTPAELGVVEDIKKMLSENITKKEIKEHFMSFSVIGEKKVIHRLVDSLIKIASDQFEESKKNITGTEIIESGKTE